MTLDSENYHDQPDILEERLSAYLDGMLDADERAQLDAHLADCETCQEQLAQLRQVRALVRALPQPALPRSFLLPVEEAPAPAARAATPPQPIQLQSAARHRAARIARAAQWLGTVAAVLGLALLISTAVLGSRGVATSGAATSYASDSGGASSPQSPTYSDNQNASPAAALPTAVSTTTRAAPEGAPGHGSTKAASGGQAQTEFSQSSPLLELQLGGAALLVVGVLLIVAGWVTRRRRMPPEVSHLG